ncbi:MAG TPA: hypothetical protein VFG14_06125 [Chthoniobacteraceae bacterium]|jgi:hypothetical protein|nr:hypothetical protein [Chthoniobacteraceae bacterium]
MLPPRFFPNIPSELLELWLSPIAFEYGWPFRSLDDSMQGTKWRYIFPKMTLRELSELVWIEERIDLASKPFTQGSLDAVKGLIQQHVLGLDTLYGNIANTQERFRACAAFIREHGDLPAPIAVVDTGTAYDLLDGNHRLAALLHVGLPPGFQAPAWVGRKPENRTAGQADGGSTCLIC